MILNFENLENNIEISPDFVSVLETENRELLLSLFSALYNDDGEASTQPFHMYDNIYDDKYLKTSGTMMFITDAINMDLNSKKILNAINERVARMCLDDEQLYRKINDANLVISNSINNLLNEFNSDFSMSLEWNAAKYLKAFDLKVCEYETNEILNKLFQYINICSDFFNSITICCLNIKSYLEEAEINELYKYAIYNRIALLLFESNVDDRQFLNEHKLIIDKEFDEFVIKC